MRILKTPEEIEAFFRILRDRASGVSHAIEQRVRKILDDVMKHGDRAVLKYTKAFDFTGTNRLTISTREISQQADRADEKVIKALKISSKRIKAFHERQREKSWSFSKEGAVLGQIIRPIERVGVYIPGGKASYPLPFS